MCSTCSSTPGSGRARRLGNDRHSHCPARDSSPGANRKTWKSRCGEIRLRLARRSMAQNWAMFRKNRIGMIGLTMIVIFALMAIAHPILMATVWPAQIYHPINGYDAPVVEKTDRRGGDRSRNRDRSGHCPGAQQSLCRRWGRAPSQSEQPAPPHPRPAPIPTTSAPIRSVETCSASCSTALVRPSSSD